MKNLLIIKSTRFHRLAKEGVWVLFGQIVSVLATFIGVRIMTEFLDPAAYGKLSLGLTVATLVGQIIFTPLQQGSTRFYAPAIEKNEFSFYWKAVIRLSSLGTGVTLLLMLVTIVGLLISGQARFISISIAAFIFAILSGYNAVLNGLQNAARQRSIVALHQAMQSVLRFVAAYGIVLWLGSTSTMAMYGYALGTFVVVGSQYIFFQKSFYSQGFPPIQQQYSNTESWQNEILKFSWPFAAWGIFYWLQVASDRWALGLLASAKDVGIYAVVFQLGYYPVLMATGIIMQLLAPVFYERIGDASDQQRKADVRKSTRQLTYFSIGITGIAFLITLLSHEQIFRVLVASQYSSASYLLPWIMLSSGIFASGQAISINLMSQMKTQEMMKPKITIALIGFALNFGGAYWYGSTGVVAAGILSSVLFLAWMFLLSNKESRNSA